MTRLRTVSPHDSGWTRRRAGRGFVYLDAQGARLSPEEVERVKALVIPPAWEKVWICPIANGHIQAVGLDAAGRRQYIYHPVWREQRDQAKFERLLTMAKRLPRARRAVAADLRAEGMPKTRALAAAVRLLDLGYFRIGNDAYTDEHGSYGLTTLEKRHVSRNGRGLLFSFTGKSGIEHEIEVVDGQVCAVVDQLRRRRSGGERLLAYRDGQHWTALSPEDVNGYLAEIFGEGVTAKDFRTWHATVIAATSLAAQAADATTKTARQRAVRAAVREVADYLGNTPTVARNSYIDPRVIDLFEDGTTIAAALARAPRSPDRRQAHLERAVLRMLRDAS